MSVSTPNSERLARAESFQTAGRFLEARRLYQEVLSAEPDNARACNGFGILLAQQKRIPEGIVWLRKAVSLDPGYFDAWTNLGTLLRGARQYQEAVEAFETAARLEPGRAAGWLGVGQCLLATGDRARALDFLCEAWNRAPDDRAVGIATAKLAAGMGRASVALAVLRRLQPEQGDDDELKLIYADMLRMAELPAEALAVLDRHFPTPPGWKLDALKASCLMAMQDLASLRQRLPRMVARWPEQADEFHAMFAKTLIMEGRMAEARELLSERVAGNAGSVVLWTQYVHAFGADVGDERLERMLETFKGASGLARVQMAFVLAQVYGRRGELGKQMHYLHIGNAGHAGTQLYEPRRADREAESNLHVYRRERLGRVVLPADSGLVPVFVLGLPRSGTTLLEQIVSAHSQVRGLGESLFLTRATDRCRRELGLEKEASFFSEPPESWLPLLRTLMLEELRRDASPEPVLIEKSINNYLVAGLLRAALPEARFIHVRRHPLDVCLGMYKQLFTVGQAFTYDLRHCAHAYMRFERVMAGWERDGLEAYPVSYEALVTDLQGEVRALLDWLGLPFEGACLDFHRNEGVVATASATQVREGLFTSAAGRWKRYGRLLDPLRSALEEYGVDADAYRPWRNGAAPG